MTAVWKSKSKKIESCSFISCSKNKVFNKLAPKFNSNVTMVQPRHKHKKYS